MRLRDTPHSELNICRLSDPVLGGMGWGESGDPRWSINPTLVDRIPRGLFLPRQVHAVIAFAYGAA